MNPHIEINGTVFTPEKLADKFRVYAGNDNYARQYALVLFNFLNTYNDEPGEKPSNP